MDQKTFENMQHSATQYRLERIEQKLDKVSEAVIAIARAEEKMVHLEKNNLLLKGEIESLEKSLTDSNKKVEEIYISHKKLEESSSRLIKLFWAGLTAAVTAFIGSILVR